MTDYLVDNFCIILKLIHFRSYKPFYCDRIDISKGIDPA